MKEIKFINSDGELSPSEFEYIVSVQYSRTRPINFITFDILHRCVYDYNKLMNKLFIKCECPTASVGAALHELLEADGCKDKLLYDSISFVLAQYSLTVVL